MRKQTFKMNGRALLLGVIAAAYPVMGYTAPAARVDFATGNVKAIGANGQSRTVVKGAQIEQGETITTNNGRAQLRFTDGAYVSLQPESEFRIDQYRFDGKQDGNEKGFFSLLKGGLRTITGLVGRSNKQNYQVSTSVATIGIRGTEYTIQYGKSVSGTVGEGEINVCNGAGCLSVTNGESYYVQGNDTKPVQTNKRTDLPPAPPQPVAPVLQPIEYSKDGTLCEVDKASCQQPLQPSPPPPLAGTQTLDSVDGNYCDGACFGSNSNTAVVFDSAGKVVSYGSIVPNSVQMGGNDGIVAWGTFMEGGGGSGALHHFVAGIPVPSADLTQLGGTTGFYSLIGATPVTNSQDVVIGKLNSASLTVNFGASAGVSAAMNWTINGASLSSTLTGSGSGSNLFLNGGCGGSCSVSADVSLFGANAARAGMIYHLQDFAATPTLDALGAAAFAKK